VIEDGSFVSPMLAAFDAAKARHRAMCRHFWVAVPSRPLQRCVRCGGTRSTSPVERPVAYWDDPDRV